MCMWCAYAGQRPAAPWLWEALGKIEGIRGGYYTGLVTLAHHKFHWGKCAGSTELWQKKFTLDEFPGTSGLIHSRTDSGGDSNFAHPFIGCHGLVAVVSQGGCTGNFSADPEDYAAAGNFLLEQDRFFRGATWNAHNRYRYALADGTKVPMAEVTANLVEYFYEQSHDPIAAMRQWAAQIHEEAANIFLFADRPGVIGFVTSNQHMVRCRQSGELMVAITSVALPEIGEEIPTNSVGLLTPEREIIESIGDIFQIDYDLPDLDACCAAAVAYLKKHPDEYWGRIVHQSIVPLFPTSHKLQLHTVMGYRVLEKLYAEKIVCFEPIRTPGGSGEPGRIFRIILVN